MRRFQRLSRALALACALAALCLASPASATVVLPLTRTQLLQRSDLVVHATVLDQRSAWTDDGTQIVTYSRLAVRRYMHGAGAQELTLRQLGGEVDGLIAAVAGDAHLRPGQDVVLFLRQQGTLVFLTAMAQAAYVVQPDAGGGATVQRDLQGLTFAMLRNGQTVFTDPGAEPAETLAHLLADVASLSRGAP